MKKFLKWGGIAVVGLIVLMVIIGASGSGDNTQQSNNGNASQEQQQQEATVIDVNTLADAFDANQVAAENEWNGKYVQFDAEISNITDSGLSFSGIDSKEFSMTQISCQIKDKQQLLSLKNGETVTVKGVVGKQTIGVIDFSNCEVVQ